MARMARVLPSVKLTQLSLMANALTSCTPVWLPTSLRTPRSCWHSSLVPRAPPIANPDEFQEKPLDLARRAAFSCGDPAVDGYFCGDRIARDIEQYQAAAFALVAADESIAAFYTLSNTSVTRDRFSRTARKDYAYPQIAAIIIGYLGRDEKLRGQRLGPLIIETALRRCYEASKSSGAALIVVDVETANGRAIDMYHDADFEDLDVRKNERFELLTLFITMKKLAAAFAA